jgi:DNA-binding CsgD family transcriptional regulator
MILTILVHSAALISGAVGLGIGTFLYALNRTHLLRVFLAFLSSLFLFVLSFFLRESGLPTPTASAGLAFITEAAGAIVQVWILPSLVFGLFVQPVPAAVRALCVVSAVLMGILVVASALAPAVAAPRIAIAVLLYGSIGAYTVLMIVWLRRKPVGREPVGHEPPDRLRMRRSLRTFVWVSAGFLPLFIADVLVSLAIGPPILEPLDNLSVPLYFVLLSAGAVHFAYRYLNRPALMEGDEVTSRGKELLGLSDREAEVVEYIMEGYSVPDAAKVMRISAKTVENHLYKVYRKAGVSNRVQLFQLFQNRRRI